MPVRTTYTRPWPPMPFPVLGAHASSIWTVELPTGPVAMS